MQTSRGISRSPYLLTVRPRVCQCRLPAEALGTFQRLERAVANGDGYWNVYVGFYGTQQMVLWFEITDLRDGKVLWRNGKPLRGGVSGTEQDQDG